MSSILVSWVALGDGWRRNARNDCPVEKLLPIPMAIATTRTAQTGAAMIGPPWSLSFFPFACFLYRREVMDAVGPYRAEYRYAEDWDFFIRACLKFSAKAYFQPCYFYRHHGSSLTSAHRD